jgi:CRP/FNR family cyclic AMP-dependent transcriptional regulator
MDKDSVAAQMGQIPLFQGLSAADTARLAGLLRPLAVRSQTNLMALEQPGDTVYAIVRGTVRVQAEQEDGSLVILAFLGAGDTVGEMSLLDAKGRSATVVAVEPCTLLWLDRLAFQACLETMPRLSLNLLRVLSRRLRMANERIQTLATLDVPGRVARQLTAFADSYGEPQPGGGVRVPLRITQGDLADIVGASRERVNQVMVELRRRGLVATTAERHLILSDPAALVARYG